MQTITRRTLLVRGALAAAALAVGGTIRSAAQTPPANERAASTLAPLVVARGRDYAGLLARVVERLGGSALLGRPGERVVIKPTLAWHRAPGQGANVHPELLRAAAMLALRGGAREVLIFDRTSMDPRVVYEVSGAAAALRSLGNPRVRLLSLTEADFVPLALDPANDPQGLLAGWSVCRHLLETDRVINLTTARHHPTRGVALGTANLQGLLGGGPASATWAQRQDAELALLGAAIRPDLTILDATRVVVRNGPLGLGSHDVERWDTLALSHDPLAVEVFGAGLFGLRAEQLGHLALAEQLGLGRATLAGRQLIEVKENGYA